MAVFNNIGDTIEGQAVDCDGKAFYIQGLKKHPITKKTMKLFTTDRTSHAVVRVAGIVPEDEKLRKATGSFHRDVDDKVTGDALSIYMDLKSSPRIETLHGKESASHRHGTQFMSVRNHTIATIKMPLHNIMKNLGFINYNKIRNKDAS